MEECMAVKEKIMLPVSISKPESSMEDGWHVVSASIVVNEKPFELKYRVSEGPLAESSDAFLAAALFPVMKIGQPLQVLGTVSPKLLAATQTIQNMFNKWFPEYQKIPVEAKAGLSEEVSGGEGVGAFFSGGVDSFYTLLKHQDEITKIIFVHGFDIMLEQTSLRLKVSGEIRRIARELGKPLIEVETNVVEFANKYDYDGTVLPSIGLLLSPQFRKIHIASNVAYDDLLPDSSHPLLEPLWSTEMLTFEQDGCEANRIEKITSIAQSEIALRSLRVCLQNPDDSYNCGQCEKCLRTMIGLKAVGALERCTAFDRKLDIEAVSQMKFRANLLPFAEENLRVLESKGSDYELANALRLCINKHKYKKMATLLNNNLNGFLPSAQGTQFVRGKRNMLFCSLWQTDSGWLLREVIKEKLKEFDERFLFGIVRRMFGMAKVDS
jgi:hypothetical protein